MRGKVDTDREIAALAARQHGVVARRQLAQLGLSNDAVDRRLAAGRLHRLHRGVFAVGHTVLKVEGRWMAATLATNGVLSHASAAAAWDLRPLGHGTIQVTVAGSARRCAGVRVHRTRALEATRHRGIPITTPARTIIDLARTLKGRPLEQALDRAEQQRLLDFRELRNRPIPPSLQAVLSHYTAPTPTRSDLEDLDALDDDVHLWAGDGVVVAELEEALDFVWRDKRLIVEVDGYAYHRSPTQFERDRERDVLLTTKGWRVLRFTWTQITRRAAWVARALDM